MLGRLGDEHGPLPRRTWQQWRATGKTPPCYKLPNGRVVCKESEFDAWFEGLLDVAAVGA
ncbi:excisionase [Glycomyces paridis]|uniref:Excisionase n=2 Tax=Glycomyces paridis TaxID=2126555 RepID=A0A4S8PGR4_9ACTN|nr:excisionase [Glycomyces paridis]